LKQIRIYLQDFVRKDFSRPTYIAVALFLFSAILLNYYLNIENGIICAQENRWSRFFMYLLLYGIAYYGTLLIYYFFEKENYFANKEVLLKSFIAIILLSFDGAFFVTKEFIQANFSTTFSEAKFTSKIINQSFPTLFYILGILFLSKKYNRHSSSLYGLTNKGFHWGPYFIMLLCMFPLLLWASFQGNFIQQYPFFKYWDYSSAFGLAPKQLFGLYEFFYLFNFVNVELLFRGLLIVGMIKCMAHRSVLPMIVTYAFLHFGKPTAETISSAFGGYILGVIAFRTENILGGLLIHIGIALLMDILALWQQLK
jgi:hypothetical protein